jgi:hypothetical protein
VSTASLIIAMMIAEDIYKYLITEFSVLFGVNIMARMRSVTVDILDIHLSNK